MLKAPNELTGIIYFYRADAHSKIPQSTMRCWHWEKVKLSNGIGLRNASHRRSVYRGAAMHSTQSKHHNQTAMMKFTIWQRSQLEKFPSALQPSMMVSRRLNTSTGQQTIRFPIFPDNVLNMYDLQVPKSPSIHESGSDTEIECSPKKVSQSSSKSSYDVPDIYDMSTDEDAPKEL